ncbi:hypothetical protein ACRALDRAFT_2026970 [Sodiomyces alcalophilus JCM 7366]|uniref:uncharacterized protein n=1 Tax=Sodiomyces alcalophilus JCM 7366 TaxID=591952 RepID=UPI0039B41E28
MHARQTHDTHPSCRHCPFGVTKLTSTSPKADRGSPTSPPIGPSSTLPAPAMENDKSLVDRLNALKGGDAGVSLDPSSNALNLPLGIERAGPPSREDALAARLKSLRNTPDRDVPPQPSSSSSLPGNPIRFSFSSKSASLSQTPSKSQPIHTGTLGPEDGVDEDPLLQTDDQTLEDLLRDEDVTSHAPAWADVAAEPGRVEALLQELSKDIPPSSPGEAVKPEDDGVDSDDSEGQKMSRDADMLMSQAIDHARLDVKLDPDPGGPASPLQEDINPTEPGVVGSSHLQPSQKPAQDDTESPAEQQAEEDQDFSLPSVPSNINPPTLHGESDDLAAFLSLPSVPTTKTTAGLNPSSSANLETDLAARMAALRLPSRTNNSNEDDDDADDDADGGGSLGLPSVPTAKPTDKTVKRLTTTTGYTDDDAETWCTVCLEDATLRCLGCDDDVYCTRCWGDMHVGPVAAFDDRTHKAVLFDKDRRKKEPKRRVALGA